MICLWVRERLGEQAQREFQEEFGGERTQIPPLQVWASLALEQNVLDDWLNAPRPVHLVAFYRDAARRYQVHPDTIRRALKRAKRKPAA